MDRITMSLIVLIAMKFELDEVRKDMKWMGKVIRFSLVIRTKQGQIQILRKSFHRLVLRYWE
jgi:hypothetical protein